MGINPTLFISLKIKNSQCTSDQSVSCPNPCQVLTVVKNSRDLDNVCKVQAEQFQTESDQGTVRGVRIELIKMARYWELAERDSVTKLKFLSTMAGERTLFGKLHK